MFAIVICNYMRNKGTAFKAQSHTEGLGYELLCQRTENHQSGTNGSALQSIVDGTISQKKAPN